MARKKPDKQPTEEEWATLPERELEARLDPALVEGIGMMPPEEPLPAQPLSEHAARELAATLRKYPDLFRPVIADLLAPEIDELVTELKKGMRK